MTTAPAHSARFLGWNTPFPMAVAQHLIARRPAMDFSDVSVIVSGGRAGRRILALLADAADEQGLPMAPPTFRTTGELPELLYHPARPAAKTFVRQLAWVGALETTPLDTLHRLFPRLRPGHDPGAWQGAAGILDRCKDELAAGGLQFDDVLNTARERNDLGNVDRWATAALIHAAYLRILREMGLCDRQEARRLAIENGALVAPGLIVLAGVVDLSHQAHAMLAPVAEHVEALIYAPPNLAGGFDRFGCVQSEYWSRRPVDLSHARLRVARSIFDQADAAFAALAEIAAPLRTDAVTIGAADESIVPHLETTAANLQNVPVRYGPGQSILHTRPVQLLSVIADYLQSSEFRHFSILARHPDVENYLRDQASPEVRAQRKAARGAPHPQSSPSPGTTSIDPATSIARNAPHPQSSPFPGTPGEGWGGGLPPSSSQPPPYPSPGVPGEGTEKQEDIGWRDWRTLLDNYAGEFLPLTIGNECLQIDGWRGDVPRDGAKDNRMYLAWLYKQIETLLGDLRESDIAKTADQWAEPILAMLRRAYGRVWDQNDERQRLLVLACKELRKGLEEMHAARDISNRTPFPKIAAHEAIRQLISLCATKRIPPPLTGNEIEIAGWLELMPDDAPHLVVTGFNEGFVPDSSRADPLLNETVREIMGLSRDRDRLARDAYLLSAMIGSREKDAVTLITGRLSSQGDPLLPSRLMFACDQKTMAQRVLKAVDLPPRTAPLALRFSHADRSGFRIGAKIPAAVMPPTDMRVTAFRDYLASPQGFYLKHILRLQTLEESAPRELDPGQCGEIVHNVLRNFAETPAAQSSSRQQCLDTILGLLDKQIETTFGASLPGALKFQMEMVRKRLQALAEHQARWVGDGWRIIHTEWAPQNAGLIVDDTAMGLRGRIDRIDYHEETGTWAVLDYKVATGEKTPERTHQTSEGWCDLQLPLYRHLAREVINEDEVKLGFVVISDTEKFSGLKMASWDDATLNDADESARQVVRDVRDGKFEEPGDSPPTDGIFGHIFGEGVLKTDPGDETEEEPK